MRKLAGFAVIDSQSFYETPGRHVVKTIVMLPINRVVFREQLKQYTR
jgi:hypothetical protein